MDLEFCSKCGCQKDEYFTYSSLCEECYEKEEEERWND